MYVVVMIRRCERHNQKRARAVWSGTISFGLVSVPVRLYPATRRQDIRFHEIDRSSGQRIRHQKVGEAPATPTLPSERGREISSGEPENARPHRAQSHTEVELLPGTPQPVAS